MGKKDSKKQQSKKSAKATGKSFAIGSRTLTGWSIGVPLLALIAVAAALLIYESNYLFRVQELNLFLYTPLFFKQQMVVSGGLLTYLGTYFTQFFYHPWIGVVLLCLWWALLMWVMKRAFNIPAKWGLVLLVPVVLLLITDVDLGYWIYYLKFRGHFFASTIGITAAVALAWGYRSLPKSLLRTLMIVLTVAVGYPLIGFYALLAALLMAVLAWRLSGCSKNSRIVDTIVAVAAIVLVPLAYYHWHFYQTNIVNIYYTGLPIFRLEEDYYAYYIPYYLLVAVLLAMAALYKKQRQSEVRRTFLWGGAQLLLLVVLIGSVCHFWFKDENFHTELSMYRYAENQQWEDILTTYRDHDSNPNRMMWMMKNLALSRLGRQGDEMYHYRNGDAAPNAPFTARLTQVGGKMVYYNYGMLNYCYRWCLEDGVEYGWRVDYYKFMLRCSLMNGEMTVAQKYIDILSKTKYYADWAQQYERFVKNPKLVANDKEFSTIMHLMPKTNELTSDNTLVEIFLINYFSAHDSDDPAYQEQAMLFALQTKDIPTFWARFYRYAPQMADKHMPIHIQEAAYLYGHLENKVDISRMPFDEEVKKTYDEFMAAAEQYRGMTEEQMKPLMYDRFGGTFYYEYFFTRGQRSY